MKCILVQMDELDRNKCRVHADLHEIRFSADLDSFRVHGHKLLLRIPASTASPRGLFTLVSEVSGKFQDNIGYALALVALFWCSNALILMLFISP